MTESKSVVLPITLYLNSLVAGPGIEPGTVAYETTVLPLHYPAIELGGGDRT